MQIVLWESMLVRITFVSFLEHLAVVPSTIEVLLCLGFIMFIIDIRENRMYLLKSTSIFILYIHILPLFHLYMLKFLSLALTKVFSSVNHVVGLCHVL